MSERLKEIRELLATLPARPWRWADWGAYFGTRENPARMDTLERSPMYGSDPDPVVRERHPADAQTERILKLEEPIENGSLRGFIVEAPVIVAELVDELERLTAWRSRFDHLARHAKRCPIGFVDGKLIRHRATTDEEVIAWISELGDLAS